MNKQYVAVASIILASLSGCISSEETGSGGRTQAPVQILGPIDTSRISLRTNARHDTSSHRSDSLKVKNRKQRTAPRFKSKQDTIQASIIVKSKSVSRPIIKIERPENPAYTIQIGAFIEVSNALRNQNIAKKRFVDLPVLNRYVSSAKIYRVSVGKFESRESASATLRKMQKKFPNDYGKCWINYIAR